MKLLVVCDESSKILGHRYLNSQISYCIGIIQFGVCIWATAQHVFSIVRYKKVLQCDFVNGTKPVLLVGVDIIIFDIGFFHSLWGIGGCVAEHLDGGYGRFAWCICHILALAISIPFAFVSRPRPCALWPLLMQQSAYGVGLLILSLAALPRVLPMFTGNPNSASLFSLLFYALGAAMNFLLLYVYWHWYWYVEAMWNSVRRLRPNHIVVNPNLHSKRTMIRYTADVVPNGDLKSSFAEREVVQELKHEDSVALDHSVWHISVNEKQTVGNPACGNSEAPSPSDELSASSEGSPSIVSTADKIADDISGELSSVNTTQTLSPTSAEHCTEDETPRYRVVCRSYSEDSGDAVHSFKGAQGRRLPQGECSKTHRMPSRHINYGVPIRNTHVTHLESSKRPFPRRLLPMPPGPITT